MGKEVGKPRGKMSSYAYFVQTCREEHKKKHPDASVNFAEFSKKCSERWKTMSAKEKGKFEDLAKQDKVRYEREMMTYVPARGGKKKKYKDPNAPKRPPSAFFIFCSEFRPKVKGENPGLTIGDVAKKLGEMWNSTAAEDKQPYEKKASKLKEKYEKDIAAYRAKGKAGSGAPAKAPAKVEKKDDDDDDDEDDEEEDEVGTVEGPVTTAFSQMLLVSSTEPRTLRNCDPPQINRPPTAQNSHLSHTVPMRPMPRTPVQEPTTGPAKRPSAPPQAVGVANNTPPPPKQQQQQQQSPTAAGNPLLASASTCQVSESVSAPTHGHTQATPPHQTTTTVCAATATPAATPLPSTSDGSLSLRPAAASSSAPTHTTSSSPPCLPKFGPTGKNATKGHHRGLGVKSIVDFEKIYKYLSVIHKPGQGCELTCMESAIVLDLLMSLPEELPLLDCKNLQKHMVQVYQTLSVPADFKIVKELLKDLKEAGETEHPTAGSQAGPDAQSTRDPEANPQQEDRSGDAGDTGPKALRPQETRSQSPGNTNTHSQCEDEDLTGLCPPLNPFMVPLKLLMRKSSAK